MTKLIRCTHCGTLFKITNESKINEDLIKYLYTDFGDKIKLYKRFNEIECISCGTLSKFETMNTYDWIADKIFTIKGC